LYFRISHRQAVRTKNYVFASEKKLFLAVQVYNTFLDNNNSQQLFNIEVLVVLTLNCAYLHTYQEGGILHLCLEALADTSTWHCVQQNFQKGEGRDR
jgi:hypothetical protein